MDYGTDTGNPKWKSLNKIPDGPDIYHAYPPAWYYRDRLGEAPAHLYDVMTTAQIANYAKKIPVAKSGVPEMAMPLTAPLFVGQRVRVSAEHNGQHVPFALGVSTLSEYVEFIKAGMARRIAAIDKEHIAPIEAGIDVLVVKYGLPDEL